MTNAHILCLAGDGIGPEIMAEAKKILSALPLDCTVTDGLIGGAAIDAEGEAYPEVTQKQVAQADCVLLGAVGGPKWDNLPKPKRAETGLLALRADMGTFANLRPALLYAPLAKASSLKAEIVSDLDILIVRELTGGIYFGEPRGRQITETGETVAFDTEIYTESEIERIARVAFAAAQKRNKRLCSVDKANVLVSSALWREIVSGLAREYPDVELTHMYVDNAAMQLVRAPKQFDVLLTNNIFGDILSDCAAMLTGSIGMLPSASLNATGKGLFEPVHGSGPDIAGQNIANPIAMILSVAMAMRYTLGHVTLAENIERSVHTVLEQGLRTRDIAQDGESVDTKNMGDAILQTLKDQL